MKHTNLILILVALFMACSSPKENALKEIAAMEANDTAFSPQAVEKLKAAYLDFADKYKDDALAPEFIFKAAQRCNVVAQHQQAIDLFQRIIDEYPQSQVSMEALFLQGYIYENSLQDYANAKRIYTAFIAKYPDSELAQDAEIAMQNLGKTPEDILESILKAQESLQ